MLVDQGVSRRAVAASGTCSGGPARGGAVKGFSPHGGVQHFEARCPRTALERVSGLPETRASSSDVTRTHGARLRCGALLRRTCVAAVVGLAGSPVGSMAAEPVATPTEAPAEPLPASEGRTTAPATALPLGARPRTLAPPADGVPARRSAAENDPTRPKTNVNAPARPPRLPPPPAHTEEDVLGARMEEYTDRDEVMRRGLVMQRWGAATFGSGTGVALGSVIGGLLVQDRPTMVSGAITGGAIALLVGVPLWLAGLNRAVEPHRYVHAPHKRTSSARLEGHDPVPPTPPKKPATETTDTKQYHRVCESLERGALPSAGTWPLLHGKELRVTDRAGTEHTGTASVLSYEPDAVTIESTRLLKQDVVRAACVPDGSLDPPAPSGPTGATAPADDDGPAQRRCTIRSSVRPTAVEGRVERLYDVDDTSCLVAGASVALDIHGTLHSLRIREIQRYDTLLIVVLSEPIERPDGSTRDRLAFTRGPEGYLLME